MRIHLLLAGALALAACGKNETTGGQAEADDSLNLVTAQGNDVTAIDAATGDDANMAGDVDYISNELDNTGNGVDENGTGNDG